MIDRRAVRSIYVAYAQIKLQLEDWHALRDIAAELETLDAVIKCESSHAAAYPAPQSLHASVDDRPT